MEELTDLSEEVPEEIESKCNGFVSVLTEVGGTVQDAAVNSEDETPNITGKSLQLYIEYNQFYFFAIFPYEESCLILESKYDLVQELVYNSNETELGGDFSNLTQEQRTNSYQQFQQNATNEQLFGLLNANRDIQIEQLDVWTSMLSAMSHHFEIHFTRINNEYLSAVVQRREYRDFEDITTQMMYETLINFTSLFSALQYTIGSAYASNGIIVPDDYDNLTEKIQSQSHLNTQEGNTESIRGFQ